ncbi:ABC transporter permease [Niveibacterium terrae]|uniref:ABC transporter permease n=1 Tax=Niveibacterium terrae TaxID=3373598 RepID=UPI003A908FE1
MPLVLKLIARNAWRHRLRTSLTVAGVVVAVLAFGLLRTFIDAWYSGAEASSASRVVTRNAISIAFPLPLAYKERIRAVPGVKRVSWANWFGGVYKEPKNFFAQFAIEPASYLAIYPELVLAETQRAEFIRDRRACIVGIRLAEKYGFRLGDTVTLKGTIYPGDWNFVVRGIYRGATAQSDEQSFFFHWDYLNESLKKTAPRWANGIGIFVVEAERPDSVAEVSLAIDSQFRNSSAETLTETEKAFQLSFVAMSDAIISAIRIVSYVVVLIIMVVMANTMAMTARERTAEYATLKALGFRPSFLALLILGESLLLAGSGGLIGLALTDPAVSKLGESLGGFLPGFVVSDETRLIQIAAAAAVGIVAALAPIRSALVLPIVAGLRAYA